MNVMMIGHAGAGKTTYMASMYEAMYEGINGFSIRADDNGLHRQLKVLAERIGQGYYPNSTDIHNEYQFRLQYNQSDVLPFTWYDYRGGALLEREDNSYEVRELINKVRSANALIVFFDGDKVMRRDNSVMREYRRTQMCIQQVISNSGNNGVLPISLVFTKGDNPGIDFERSPMFEFIQKMIQGIAEYENTFGMLTTTIINKHQISNVQFPFLTSILFGLIREKNSMEAEIEEHASNRDRYNNNAGFWDDLDSFFSGEDSYRELARKEHNRLLDKLQLYERLLERAQGMAKLIDDAAEQEYIHLI